MSSRRNILLIGGIYLLAIVGLLGAAWLVVRAIPHAAPVPTPIAPTENIPTLRPLWPPPARTPGSGQVARATSRTTLTVTSRPLSTATRVMALVQTPTRTPTAPATLKPTAHATVKPTVPTVRPTLAPAGSLTPTLTAVPLLPASVVPTSTATTLPATATGSTHGRVSGRVLLDGQPAPAGLVVRLQTQAYATVAETTVSAGGAYAFANVRDSSEGYDVTFAQEWNAAAYQHDTIATWAWLGPVKVQNGVELSLPDLEISLSGMKPLTPAFETKISAQVIAAGQPISFTWSAYPQASAYWLDLTGGSDNHTVWQSPLVQTVSATWNGRTSGGTPATPGEYWWSVGARREVSPYTLIVYSYLTKLVISAN